MTMLRDAVMQAATRPEIRSAVARVYADLQREIDARKPLCTASGRCCRFEEFGHRLYVTTIELAAFASSLSLTETASAGSAVPNALPPHHETAVRQSRTYGGGCPFQINGLCSVHTIRPFGCRVFFCDSTSDQWQHEQYERFHAALKRLHEDFAVPYRYVEWREALRQLDLLPADCPEPTNRLSLPQLPL